MLEECGLYKVVCTGFLVDCVRVFGCVCVCLCVKCTPQLSVWFFGVKAYCNVVLCLVGDELCSIVLNLIHELLFFG